MHLEDHTPIQQLALFVLFRFLQRQRWVLLLGFKTRLSLSGGPAQGLSVRWVPGLTSFEECCLLITQLVLAALLSWLSWQAICHSVISPTLFDTDGTFSKESTFFLSFFLRRWGSHRNKHLGAYFLGCWGPGVYDPCTFKRTTHPINKWCGMCECTFVPCPC